MENKSEYMKEWRRKNAGHKKAYARKWYADNVERQKTTGSKWRAQNPERIIELNKCGAKKRKIESPWSSAYRNAHQRCNNPNSIRYARYGGRGIRFKMTMQDFEHLWYRDNAFMMERPSIDRIDNDGDYSADNCRFIEKCYNKRSKTT